LKRKKPSRREGVKYWGEGDFERLKAAPSGKLYSKGPLPWRLLAYLLKVSPDVELVRRGIRKRPLGEARVKAGEKALDQRLLTLHHGGFVKLEPEPPGEPGAPAPGGGPPPGADATGSPYVPLHAVPTPALDQLLIFRSIHPLYGAFLLRQL